MHRATVRSKSRTEVSTRAERSISWQGLLEALPDGTALLDGHGVMHYVNAQLAYLTGYSHDELGGQNVAMLIPPELRPMEGEAGRRYARDPVPRIIWNDGNLSVLCKDATDRSVDFALSPLSIEGKRWAL